VPPTNGAVKIYEQLDGRFQRGDVCSYKINSPSSTDLNDMMYVSIELLHNTKATLVKGSSLLTANTMYSLSPG